MDINKLDKRQLHDLAKQYHKKTCQGGYYLHQMIDSGEITMQDKWDNFIRFVENN